MNKQDKPKGAVVVYKNRIEVKLEQETVWLRQEQIAGLFGTQRPAITKHIANILKSGELKEKSVSSVLEHTASDKKTYKTKFYNLDMILSVGYRVNSSQATQFRIWATRVLKRHLIEGYTLNEKRLRSASDKYLELQKSLKLLGNVVYLNNLSAETKGVIQVISDYSRALELLDDFDHQRLDKPKGTKRQRFKLTYETAKNIIAEMIKKYQASDLVGREKDQGLHGSIGALYQTFDGKELYPTVEEKAAYLLYFVVKNHSFVDGNKRIAALLFIYFLEKNGLLYKPDATKRLDDNALVALTLMTAASRPEEKDTMIRVILNLLHS